MEGDKGRGQGRGQGDKTPALLTSALLTVPHALFPKVSKSKTQNLNYGKFARKSTPGWFATARNG